MNYLTSEKSDKEINLEKLKFIGSYEKEFSNKEKQDEEEVGNTNLKVWLEKESLALETKWRPANLKLEKSYISGHPLSIVLYEDIQSFLINIQMDVLLDKFMDKFLDLMKLPP